MDFNSYSTPLEKEQSEVKLVVSSITNGCDGCIFENSEHSPKYLPCRRPDNLITCVMERGRFGIYLDINDKQETV